MKRTIICMLLVVAMCLGITSCAKEEPWKSDFLSSLESENSVQTQMSFESDEETLEESVEEPPEEFYVLSWDYGEIAEIYALGENFLVMALKDNQMQLVCVDSDDGHTIAKKILDETYGITTEIVNSQVRMYQHSTMTWTWLDEQLQTVKQYTLPSAVIGWPYMDAGNQYIYYVDDTYQLIQYKMSNNTKRVLKSGFEQGTNIYLESLLDGGNIVVLSSYVDNLNGVGGYRMNFVDTQMENSVRTRDGYVTVEGWENYYCAELYTEGRQLTYGRYDQSGIQEIIFKDYNEYSQLCTFPESGKVMTWLVDDRGIGQFSLYSMETGKKEACCSLELEKDSWGSYRLPWQAVYLEERDAIVFSYVDDSSRLFVWNTSSSMCDDEFDYTQEYLSWDAKDEEMHKQLRNRAYDLGKHYGVFVYISDLCPTNYYGYVAERSFSVRAMEHGLNIVEKALAAYPEGFFQQLSENPRGKLKICLVDSLYPAGADSLETTTALFNYDDSSQAIVLSLSAMSDIEELFYHETSHAIDMKLYDSAYQYWTDEAWDALNPDGFLYDNSYVSNSQMFDSRYVWELDNEAYFVDTYSKSFPTEDRARLMEYAMGKYPDTQCFESEMIRAKLAHRATCIRENFDTTGWPEVTSWERPLITD